jgi:hypothetical protein
MGGKSAPPPDYAPLATASREAAQIMSKLGREQLGFAKQQYGEMAPLLRGIAERQAQAQEQQMKQAQDYYQYMQSTIRPAERKAALQAQYFDTEEYRNQLAAQAAADAGKAFTQTQEAQKRAAAGMGINPASGRFAGMQNQAALGLAAQKAGAMTGTRQQAQQMGYARLLDVSGLGRNLPGASSAAYAGATGAGSAAGQSYMAPGNQYANMFNQGVGTIGQGQNMQMQGLSNILNTQGQLYGAVLNQPDPLTTIASAGLTAYGLRGSDIRIKENIEQIGVHFRTGLPIYEFNYTHIPDKRFRGVMAQDVEKVFPDAVEETHDGIKMVNYAMLGMEMEEV